MTQPILSAPTADETRILRYGLAVLAANLLLVLSARIQVPFWPVPMTMQTLAVLAVGMALGARAGVLAIGLYLFEGALGLPVFAGTPERGIGLAYMMGPTGGYLAGFLLAGALLGHAADKGWTAHWLRAAASLTAGHVLILGLGAAWLAVLFGWSAAWTSGIAPFIAATVVKCALGAALSGPLAWIRQRL